MPHTTTVTMSDKLYEKLQKVVSDSGVTLQAYIRQLIVKDIEEKEK